MIDGVFDWVTCLDSAAVVNRLEPLRAEDTELPLRPRVLAPRLCGVVMIGRPVRSLVVAGIRLHLRVELANPLRIPRQRFERHRTVDEHGEHRDATLLLEPLQPVEQLLDAADGKRRDDDAAASPGGGRNDVRQTRTIVIGFVHAIAIRRFHQQVIRFGDHRRIGQHRPVEAAQIAAEENRPSA